MLESGKLIVLEAVDDEAPTEVASALCRWLRDAGQRVECTREPTYGPAGTQILLFEQGRLQLDPVSEALLRLADCLDHVQREDGIDAWLAAGHHVVCVHYSLAACAQQWGLLEWDWLQRIQGLCRVPDLEIFLDLAGQDAKCEQLRAGYLQVVEHLQGRGRKVTIVESRDDLQVYLACQGHVAQLLGLEARPC